MQVAQQGHIKLPRRRGGRGEGTGGGGCGWEGGGGGGRGALQAKVPPGELVPCPHRTATFFSPLSSTDLLIY